MCSKLCTTLHRARSLCLNGQLYKSSIIDLSKFTRLRQLSLVDFTSQTFRGLNTLTQLHELTLRGGFPEIIDYCRFPELDMLHIHYGDGVDDDCLSVLFHQLSTITFLTIELNYERSSLSQLTILQRLETLRIFRDYIDPEQFQYLNCLPLLTRLEFRYFNCTTKHIESLPTLTTLQIFRLGSFDSGNVSNSEDGLKCIADSFTNLKSLSYYPVPVLPDNITQLRRLEYLAFLEFGPTNSITILSTLPNLTYLTTLLAEEQWEQLTALTQLKILRCFNADENTMSFPHLKIIDLSDEKFPVGML